MNNIARGYQELFNTKAIQHGGRTVRGVVVACGYCNAEEELPVNTFSGHSGDGGGREVRFVQHKMEALGWKIGRKYGGHRCPKCFTAIKITASNRSAAKRIAATNGEEPVKPVIKSLNDIAPRMLGRDDRRIIFEKLNEVYLNDKVGYAVGWTDEKVANDLGVPRAWVKIIRDENFGEELANEEIKLKVAEASQKLIEIMEAVTRATGFWDDVKRLSNEAEHIGKNLDVIRKAVGA